MEKEKRAPDKVEDTPSADDITPVNPEKTQRVIEKRSRSLIGRGKYCPDCGGLCGNSKHDRPNW